MDFDADNDDASTLQGELDAILKVEGFSALGALYWASAQSGPRWREQTLAAVGFHVQVGYVIEGWLQPALRYAFIHFTRAPDRHEATVGAAAYLYKHHAKLQVDTAFFMAEGRLDVHTRVLLQLAF